MTPIQGGAAARTGAAPDASNTPDLRRERDLSALADARPPAERAARALLAALMSPDTTNGELEARSRAALDAVGALWERVARVNQ